MRDLNWQDLNVFEHVARLGGIRKAAHALSVHHSTVSRHIDRLEARLATRLFDRHPNGLVLTHAGEILLEESRTFSDALFDVQRQIVGEDKALTGQITVTMVPPVAEYIFAPRLDEFARQYPGVEVRLISSVELFDLSRLQADIAVRMDNNPPETLVGKRLFPYYETVYCSPDYLGSRDPEVETSALRWIRWDIGEDRHPDWTQNTEFKDVPAWGYFPSINLQLRLAAGGFGLAMLPCLMGDPHPGLVRATSAPPRRSRDIWILTHADLKNTARVRAFMGFAEQVLRDAKPQITGVLDT